MVSKVIAENIIFVCIFSNSFVWREESTLNSSLAWINEAVIKNAVDLSDYKNLDVTCGGGENEIRGTRRNLSELSIIKRALET